MWRLFWKEDKYNLVIDVSYISCYFSVSFFIFRKVCLLLVGVSEKCNYVWYIIEWE